MAVDVPITDERASEGAALLARLDRLTVWPYPWMVLVVTGAGFFFSAGAAFCRFGAGLATSVSSRSRFFDAVVLVVGAILTF